MVDHSAECHDYFVKARNDTTYLPVTPNADVAGVGVWSHCPKDSFAADSKISRSL